MPGGISRCWTSPTQTNFHTQRSAWPMSPIPMCRRHLLQIVAQCLESPYHHPVRASATPDWCGTDATSPIRRRIASHGMRCAVVLLGNRSQSELDGNRVLGVPAAPVPGPCSDTKALVRSAPDSGTIGQPSAGAGVPERSPVSGCIRPRLGTAFRPPVRTVGRTCRIDIRGPLWAAARLPECSRCTGVVAQARVTTSRSANCSIESLEVQAVGWYRWLNRKSLSTIAAELGKVINKL